ncbi:MAG: hypothetical protein EA428_01075 [Spirochaetaceae bacterium]|nr:MAG: hypothetical protein EA428_01075 [Spirochaetaceae bacterium]
MPDLVRGVATKIVGLIAETRKVTIKSLQAQMTFNELAVRGLEMKI